LKEEMLMKIKVCPECKGSLVTASIQIVGYTPVGYWCVKCEKLYRIKKVVFEELNA
jgi:uncharacterized protein YbaR (Trm112 family)